MAEANPVRLHMERHKGKLVEIIDSEFGLLNTLLKNRVLSDIEIGRIKAKSSRYEKNEMLLDYIARTEKQEEFLAALTESSQTHIVNWITADGKYRNEFGLYWPLTARETNILNHNQADLVKLLETSDLLDMLLCERIINDWHKAAIAAKPTDYDRNEALLDIVRRLSREHYCKLVKCVRDSNQGHIADILEKGGAIVPVHATLKSQNLNEVETQLVAKMHDLLCSNTTTMEQETRVLAALELKVIAVRRGESIVLYIRCCKEEDFKHLCKVVDNMVMKETLEKLFNLFLPSLKLKVVAVNIFERDIAKAKESFKLRGQKDSTATVKVGSAENEALKQIRSLSECSICLDTYIDPRILACLHTACLKCFENIQFKNQKKPGDILPCPICRRSFSIPSEGMRGLPKNFFMESLVRITEACNSKNIPLLCTTCSLIEEANGVNEATMKCLNCCENYCLRCSKIHRSQKFTRDHKIVQITPELNEEEFRNRLPVLKCRRHPDKVLNYYCKDCRIVVCVSCSVEQHRLHYCKEVYTFDKHFRCTLKEHSRKVHNYKDHILSNKVDIERQKRDFLKKSMETENVIRLESHNLKALIEQHTQDVLNELLLLRQKYEKSMDADIKEIERKVTVLESYVTCCTELTSKGYPNEVCAAADNLIAMAEQISLESEEYLRAPSKSFEINFTTTIQSEFLQNCSNVVGILSESTKQFDSCVIVMGRSVGETISSDVIKINLKRPEDISTPQPIPTQMQRGAAAAVYCNSIFLTGIGKTGDEIWKFDAKFSKWMKCASLLQGRQSHSVAFVDHALYMCGGYVDNRTLDDVEAYHAIYDKCSRLGKLTYGVRNSGNCVPFKGKLYIFGGWDSKCKTVNKVQVYDTKSNTCTLLLEPIPKAAYPFRAVMWEDSVILVSRNNCLLYDFDTETWNTRNQFKPGVTYFGLTLNDGKLFVIGGARYANENPGGYIKWIPVANVLKDEPTEWKNHANFPETSEVHVFEKLNFYV